jgi:hypothetical protein
VPPIYCSAKCRLMCRVPDAGHARRSRGHPGRRPEAAKERTRGLYCEAQRAAMGIWLMWRVCLSMRNVP